MRAPDAYLCDRFLPPLRRSHRRAGRAPPPLQHLRRFRPARGAAQQQRVGADRRRAAEPAAVPRAGAPRALSGHARALFALALFACTSMHDTPESVTRALVDAIGRGDAAAATALFADDATVFFPVDAAPLRADGKAAIGEVFAKLLKPGNGVPPPPEDLRVQPPRDMAGVDI